MNDKITPGQKIRLARCARQLGVRQLGALINLTGGSISLIERGEVSIKLDQYEQIQAVLGFRFDTPEAEAAFAFFLRQPNQAANGH